MTQKNTDLGWLTARPIAHRGYHDMNRTIFENSPSAFARAIEHGFAIECDVHLASDGVPVIFHDDDLQRICGLPGDIRLMTSGELALKSIGGTKDKIPSLPQLLSQVCGQVPLVIELKGRKDEDEGFAETVIECLESYQGHVALMSFDHWLLHDLIKAKCPWPVGLTAEGTRPETFFVHEEAVQMGLDFISYCVQHLPNTFITGQRQRGMPVITWTVRDEEMRRRSAEQAEQMTFEGFDPDE